MVAVGVAVGPVGEAVAVRVEVAVVVVVGVKVAVRVGVRVVVGVTPELLDKTMGKKFVLPPQGEFPVADSLFWVMTKKGMVINSSPMNKTQFENLLGIMQLSPIVR